MWGDEGLNLLRGLCSDRKGRGGLKVRGKSWGLTLLAFWEDTIDDYDNIKYNYIINYIEYVLYNCKGRTIMEYIDY